MKPPPVITELRFFPPGKYGRAMLNRADTHQLSIYSVDKPTGRDFTVYYYGEGRTLGVWLNLDPLTTQAIISAFHYKTLEPNRG